MKLITIPILFLLLCTMIFVNVPAENNFIMDLHFILRNLKNHNSFQYINRNALSETFHKDAMYSMNDAAVYLLLSDTKTPASRFLSYFTKDRYNHISLSFDAGLKTIVSYNGGNSRFLPGLNPENILDLLSGQNSRVLVYRLKLTTEQKRDIFNRVIDIDEKGSSYNIIGLITRKSHKPNIMYCSQFIYNLLRGSGLQYFIVSERENIKPSDFIELDYKRYLDFCFELKGCCNENMRIVSSSCPGTIFVMVQLWQDLHFN